MLFLHTLTLTLTLSIGILLLTATTALTSKVPSTAFDLKDPLFRRIFPYSVLSGTIICDSSKFTGNPTLWNSCKTCKSLKVVPPTILRSVKGVQVAADSPDEESIASSGFAAGVTFNTTTKTAIVFYRGTKASLDNFAADVQAAPVTTINGIQVHSGFLDTFNELQPLVDKELKRVLTSPDACPKCNTVAFTGHSLGAALATIGTYMYAVNGTLGDRKFRLYTFGSPRVGSEGLFKAIEKTGKLLEHIRIVNAQDIVPTVPFSTTASPADQFTHLPNSLHWWDFGEKRIRSCTKPTDTDAIGNGIGKNCDRSLAPPVRSDKKDQEKGKGKKTAKVLSGIVNTVNKVVSKVKVNSNGGEGDATIKVNGDALRFGINDHRTFGPFPQGAGYCDDDFSKELEAIPFHQVVI
ncbi:hypothetical protein HDU97_007826 [Phlyctochytrium planicorne]|nr:hypothetical protein HDU97_007826 [Phlyctochytrium planicorne]